MGLQSKHIVPLVLVEPSQHSSCMTWGKEAEKAAKLAEAAIPAQRRADDQADALAAAANHAKEIKEATYQGARDLGRPSEGEKSKKGDGQACQDHEAEGGGGWGKQLEKNQLEMISKEKELTEELKMLQL